MGPRYMGEHLKPSKNSVRSFHSRIYAHPKRLNREGGDAFYVLADILLADVLIDDRDRIGRHGQAISSILTNSCLYTCYKRERQSM